MGRAFECSDNGGLLDARKLTAVSDGMLGIAQVAMVVSELPILASQRGALEDRFQDLLNCNSGDAPGAHNSQRFIDCEGIWSEEASGI